MRPATVSKWSIYGHLVQNCPQVWCSNEKGQAGKRKQKLYGWLNFLKCGEVMHRPGIIG